MRVLGVERSPSVTPSRESYGENSPKQTTFEKNMLAASMLYPSSAAPQTAPLTQGVCFDMASATGQCYSLSTQLLTGHEPGGSLESKREFTTIYTNIDIQNAKLEVSSDTSIMLQKELESTGGGSVILQENADDAGGASCTDKFTGDEFRKRG